MWKSSWPLIIAGNSFDEGMSISQPAPFCILFIQSKSASELFCLGLLSCQGRLLGLFSSKVCLQLLQKLHYFSLLLHLG
jgi:hypothetical protein